MTAWPLLERGASSRKRQVTHGRDIDAKTASHPQTRTAPTDRARKKPETYASAVRFRAPHRKKIYETFLVKP